MGNPQHLDWLLEGVEAWNARRAREDFEPDFSGFDIRGAFEAAGKLDGQRRIPLAEARLVNADLEGADLEMADLRKADLRGARLTRTDLRNTDFREARLGTALFLAANLEGANLHAANLRSADMRGANLKEANFQLASLVNAEFRSARFAFNHFGGSDLRGADFRTTRNDSGQNEVVDLRTADALTQSELDKARGDNGVLLPDGLTHPAHWPVLDEIETAETPLVTETPPSGSEYAQSVVSRILAHAALHKTQARLTAAELRGAVQMALPEGTNDTPLIFRITGSMADILNGIADDIDKGDTALHDRIAELEREVARLTTALEDATARTEAEAALAEVMKAELSEAKAGQDGYWSSVKSAAGEKTISLPVFFAKAGAIYYLATLLGPNHPLVKLLFDIVNALKP